MIHVLTRDVPSLSLREGDRLEGSRGLGAILGRHVSAAEFAALLDEHHGAIRPLRAHPESVEPPL